MKWISNNSEHRNLIIRISAICLPRVCVCHYVTILPVPVSAVLECPEAESVCEEREEQVDPCTRETEALPFWAAVIPAVVV